METLIVHPQNEEQLTALMAFMKALKITFEKKESPYNQDFVSQILQGDQDFEEGKGITVDLDKIWK